MGLAASQAVARALFVADHQFGIGGDRVGAAFLEMQLKGVAVDAFDGAAPACGLHGGAILNPVGRVPVA